jgi:hypothetical protein
MLVDTDVLIWHLRGYPQAKRVIRHTINLETVNTYDGTHDVHGGNRQDLSLAMS